MDEFWLFLGRFHPMMVHLPIGIILAAVILEALTLKLGSERLRTAITVMLVLGAISAVMSALHGLMLASSDEYTGDTVWWHRTLGVSTASGAVIAFALHHKWQADTNNHRLVLGYRCVLLLTVACLAYGGHLGGVLTHGENYLFEKWPNWLPGKPAEEVVQVSDDEGAKEYRMVAQPVLRKFCYKCHGPDKQKGKMRLDKPNGLFVSEEGRKPVLTPGDPGKSELVTNLLLPLHHDDVMPPEKEKKRPSDKQIMDLVRWIQNGAYFPDKSGKNAAPPIKSDEDGEAKGDDASAADPDPDKPDGDDAAQPDPPPATGESGVAKPEDGAGNAAPAAQPGVVAKPDAAAPPVAAGGVYTTKIVPILEKSCIKCHGPKKPDGPTKKGPKGGLRLDSPEWIKKGTEDTPHIIVPRNPSKSVFYTRTTLPKDHDDVMPSKGDLLTKEQQETIRKWIAAGAVFE